jgi:hypothetical protein
LDHNRRELPIFLSKNRFEDLSGAGEPGDHPPGDPPEHPCRGGTANEAQNRPETVIDLHRTGDDKEQETDGKHEGEKGNNDDAGLGERCLLREKKPAEMAACTPFRQPGSTVRADHISYLVSPYNQLKP